VRESSKINSSRIKKTLAASHRVQFWFWDGEREYEGEAIELSTERVTAFLKVHQTGDATVVPTRKLVEGMAKTLGRRTVELKLTSGTVEAAVKARITDVQPDFENPRRLLLEAEFEAPSAGTRAILGRLAQVLNRKNVP
jgi:hypothetical protein